MEERKLKKILDKFLVKFAESNPNTPLTPEIKNTFERRLHQIGPQLLRTPTHPPYQSMIIEAIFELNKNWGANKESISKFIKNKKEYGNLPVAHEEFLSHYLDKLREKGEIHLSPNKCYYKVNRIPQIGELGQDTDGKEPPVEESLSHQQSTGPEENMTKNPRLLLRIVRNKKGDTWVDQSGSKWARIELVEAPKDVTTIQNQREEKCTQLVEEQDESRGKLCAVSAKQEQTKKVNDLLVEPNGPGGQVNNKTNMIGQHKWDEETTRYK